ncbi:transporter, drug/metabolite exporter family [Lactococcus lactis subsp. lactis IO-1]|nr:transporter, drug/metabolite exporter family [Lactococcus lactis subsp. lactis IO-1]
MNIMAKLACQFAVWKKIRKFTIFTEKNILLILGIKLALKPLLIICQVGLKKMKPTLKPKKMPKVRIFFE